MTGHGGEALASMYRLAWIPSSTADPSKDSIPAGLF